MIDAIANGFGAASGGTGAYVQTLAVDTGLAGQALGIRSASGHAFATVADESLRTNFVGGADDTTESVNALLIVEAFDV